MRYLCDQQRHLICDPYSLDGLHQMAEQLGIHRRWFHAGDAPHYDIPKRMMADIVAQCEVVRPREILRVIRAAQAAGRLF